MEGLKLLIVVGALVLCAIWSRPDALAQEEGKTLASRVARSEALGFQGVVTAVDLESNTVTVAGNEGPMVFILDFAGFKGRFGVGARMAEDLHPGDTVAVRYATVDGKNYATLVGKE